MTLELRQIIAEAPNRPPGYVEDVLSRGVISGDTVEFDEVTWGELLLKYRGSAGRGQPCCGG